MFFFTSNLQKGLIARKMDTDDNVIPSSNSIMANNLFKLGHYFSNGAYLATAETMLNNVKNKAMGYGAGASNWFILYSNYIGNFYEVAVVGKDAKEKLVEINKHYLPNKLIAGSLVLSEMPLLKDRFTEGETNIFICVNNSCKLPTEKSEEAIKMIETNF
jgi:uncharacterized protein YyaL (SSP411 family)